MRWLPLVLVMGCVDRAGWESVPIERAWLDSFHLSRFDVVVGVAEGDALLGFDGPAGGGAVPVHLGGGGVGLLFDVSIDPEGHDGSVEIDLSDVDDPSVGDVFGTYKGTNASASMVVGGSTRRMRNGRGASFVEGHLVVGVGLEAGFEWIVLREGGNDGAEPIEPDPSLPTGETGDTGVAADTGPSFAPTARRGCGCGEPDDDGTDTDGTATSGTTTGGTTTGGTTTAGSSGDGGGDGCDCGADGGCACSQGTLAPVGLLWAGVLIRRRARSRER